MSKLSIITINRNNAEGLKRTLDSVKSQTCQEFEHIIIDGASTDGSVEIIKEYVHQLEIGDRKLEFYWVSEPDGGVYQAMNKGIRKAKGEYCLFLNSGDFLIAPDVLERVFTQDIKADIINARCNVSNNGKVVWTTPYLPKVTLKDLYFVGLPHQSTFIRRSLFTIYGMYREDFRYNSDIAFWYKTIVIGDATTSGLNTITTDYNLDGISSKEAQTDEYKREETEIFSQGFLPKVLPDYELWKEERCVWSKYSWIDQHVGLQKMLRIYRKFCKHIGK